jgi:N-methylhydantoinase A/oxoprolinase/acetone carboxylase beta subunit
MSMTPYGRIVRFACQERLSYQHEPPQSPKAGLRLAVDIGGTFTDVAAFDDTTGTLTFGKALSTPTRLVEGINAAVDKAGTDYAAAGLFLHGTTIAINTILERTGARTALVTTEGFRDRRGGDGAPPRRRLRGRHRRVPAPVARQCAGVDPEIGAGDHRRVVGCEEDGF